MSSSSAPPLPTPRPGQSGGRSVLAADMRITGEITTQGSIEIHGEVEGSVAAHTVVIGGDGRLTGTVSADQIEVRGRLDGRVSCIGLTLRAASSVKCDASYETLVIESGAQVEGRFTQPKPDQRGGIE